MTPKCVSSSARQSGEEGLLHLTSSLTDHLKCHYSQLNNTTGVAASLYLGFLSSDAIIK